MGLDVTCRLRGCEIVNLSLVRLSFILPFASGLRYGPNRKITFNKTEIERLLVRTGYFGKVKEPVSFRKALRLYVSTVKTIILAHRHSGKA